MHPPAPMEGALTELLAARATSLSVVTDPTAASDAIDAAMAGSCDLLVVSACWFSMTQDRYSDQQRAVNAVGPARQPRRAIEDAWRGGCPVLALHTGIISFDDWAAWPMILGGRWNWETSWHPPPGPLHVVPEPGATVAVEPFSVVDEEYQGLEVLPSSRVVARSENGHPLLWTSQQAGGRAAVSLLGHDSGSLREPRHQAALHGLIDWLTEDGPAR